MAAYKIWIKKEAEKELLDLPKVDLIRVTKKIQKLQMNPRLPGCERLQGEDAFRIRQGNYRVVYLIDDHEKVVRILKVGHRREVYR